MLRDEAATLGCLHSVAFIDPSPPFDIPRFADLTHAPSCRASPVKMPTPSPLDRLAAKPLAEFMAEQVVIDYVVDDLLVAGYLYALTGPTGAGKTAVAVLLALSVGTGRNCCGRDVKRGPVLYVAGENAADVRARFAVACQKMDIRPENANVHVLDRSFVLADRAEELLRIVDEIGPALIIVDTDQAVSLGNGAEENDNAERMVHAKRLRDLTRTRNSPCVVDLCHPRARARRDDLIPRGGSSLLAEIDGNLALWRTDDRIELFNDPDKFRGAPFSIFFKKSLVESDAVQDRKGRRVKVPFYEYDDAEAKRHQHAEDSDDAHRLMHAMLADPKGTQAAWATACGWLDSKGEPRKDRVNRQLKRLKSLGKVKQRQGNSTLTPEARAELEAT